MGISTVYKCDDGTTHETLIGAEMHEARWGLIQQLESFYEKGDSILKHVLIGSMLISLKTVNRMIEVSLMLFCFLCLGLGFFFGIAVSAILYITAAREGGQL